MKRKLSNQFLGNFLVMLLLTILATIFAFVMLSFASGLISGSLVKNRYPAGALIKEDYRQIDAAGVVEKGGGVQVIDKEYRVVYSSGLDTIGKDKLTREFTEFLTQEQALPHDTLSARRRVLADSHLPTSIRIDFELVHNKEAYS